MTSAIVTAARPDRRIDGQWNTKWTVQLDSEMTTLYGLGYSFFQIAAELNAKFGTTFTRNAAIGRACRMGIAGSKSETARGSGNKPAFSKPREPGVPRPRRVPAPKLPKPIFHCDETGHRVADVVPLNLPLLELGPGMCRWPYGEGPYVFCGHGTLDEASYCCAHQALATRPDIYRLNQ
jgi:GcrA cell cycle regulator